jgi:hypothetical protein
MLVFLIRCVKNNLAARFHILRMVMTVRYCHNLFQVRTLLPDSILYVATGLGSNQPPFSIKTY